jgi:outer membrane protein insertion porin family
LALTLSLSPASAQSPAVPAVGPATRPAAPGPTVSPASNQAAAAAANPAAAPAAPAQQRIIQHIVVTGTQRVEADTVLTYLNMREGDAYDPAQADQALKALFATGLFTSATRLDFNNATGTLTVRVTENPIVNQVVFEGNSKVSDKDLTKEVQIKPRAVFTRAKVQSDVQRIIEVYRRAGKFAARVEPQIIQRPQNRVDLIFSIKEGPTTGIARINFIGNKVYSDDTLKSNIATEESAWWKFLASNDNYDPDRLAFDREQLRRFYVNHGYADFHVISAVAQLAPNRENFYLTFTVDEGAKYHFGKVSVNSKIKDLDLASLRALIPFKEGDVYDAELIQKSIDALTNAAGTKGYAFAEVHPRIARNQRNHTADLTFDIEQGPRVYIEKIDITGNSRTLDKVIRREFRLTEGDAFNQVLVDRSRTRIRSLGFFSNVEVKNAPGSQPDRTNVTVAVTEQSTGSIQLGLGYSSVSQLVGEFTYTELNMFGRGQNMTASVQISQIQKQYQFSFTEPYFLDRPLVAGFDLFKSNVNYQQATYQSDTTGLALRMGFPISEYSTVGLRYSYQITDILPFSNAPLEIQLAAGHTYGSIFGFTYGFSDLDDARKPTTGSTFSFSQDFAGFGGNLRYIRSESSFSTYHPFFGDSVVGSFTMNAGYITGYDGTPVPIQQRFFKGADTFRGFKLAGVGPRDIVAAQDTGAIGGNVFAIGTIAARLPALLPESYGVSLGLFTDFGTVGRVDNAIRTCTIQSCVKDNLAFRASAGVSIQWKSPFGPVSIDLGLPIVKAPYDRAQILHFSGATGSQ